MKYRDLLSEWWAEYSPSVADTTAWRKECEMQVHILPKMGDFEATDIDKRMIQDFINHLSQHGSPLRHPGPLAPITVEKIYQILAASFRYAVEKEYIEINPTIGITRPKIKAKEIKIFKPDEVSKLIAAARPKWLGDIILLAYRTGMRRGEIYGLQWDDIDFKGKFLMIRRSISARRPGERLLHPPKTRTSIRRIALDNLSLDMLKRRRKEAKSIWVFENQYGKPLSPWNNTKYMAEACNEANIPHRCFHTLRHSHATYLLSKNVNPKIVQERLGHAHISTTLDTYSHVLPSMQRVIVDILNED